MPNRECKGCGERFYDEKARLEFCEDCNPESGENNGNWMDAKESTKCVVCDRKFEYYPSDKKGLYCSDCVETDGTFKNAPYWRRGERIQRECGYCGNTDEVLKSEIERGQQRFCSRECLSKWMSENWRGEDHHQWKGGDVDYTGRWQAVRREALNRDDYQCQRCGKTQNEIGREPDVHHLIPVRRFDDSHEAHRLLNVVCLCRRCHPIVESQSS